MIATKGYGSMTIVTRGYARGGFWVVLKREVLRLVSQLKRVLFLESRI